MVANSPNRAGSSRVAAPDNTVQQRTAPRKPPERFPFIKTRLLAVPIPLKGRVYVYDTAVPGLALCVTEAGGRTFYVYRKVNGQPQRMRLGVFPEGLTIDQARTLAKAIVGDIARGADPLAERRAAREMPTLWELFERWREVYAKAHRKRWRDDERMFNKYLCDFHSRRINQIRTPELAVWHTKAGERYGPVQANRALELLRAIYNKASDLLGYEGANPTRGVKRFGERSRDRFLQAEELGPFFRALAEEPEDYRDFFASCLFTGARRSNVQAMAWADIHFQARVWRIPETKAGVPVVVPLCDPVVEILKRRADRFERSVWVFPAPSRTGHLVEPRKSWRRVLKKAGLADLRIHDLRRSLGSWQAITGTSLPIIGQALGHSTPEATAIYARLTMEPVRQSVERATQAMIEAGNARTDDPAGAEKGGSHGTE